MLSAVAICNRALEKLGATPITSLSDDSREGRACNRTYEPLRNKLLREHVWNFAVKRDDLAAATTTPSWGYSYEFPLPDDFLRLLEIQDIADYQIEAADDGTRVIRCDDAGPIYIRYVALVTDTAKFDPLFDEALACLIAFELCEELTQSNNKKAAAGEDLRRALQTAKTVDAQENPPDELSDGGWWDSRA